MFEYDIAEYSQSTDLCKRGIEEIASRFLKLQKWIIEEKRKWQ